MKKIWVIQYNNGEADVFDTEHPVPAYPFVDAFEAEEEIEELKKEIKELKYQQIIRKKEYNDY